MRKDKEGYMWVLLVSSKFSKETVYVYGIYSSYEKLQKAIEEIETNASYTVVYDYEQVPID